MSSETVDQPATRRPLEPLVGRFAGVDVYVGTDCGQEDGPFVSFPWERVMPHILKWAANGGHLSPSEVKRVFVNKTGIEMRGY